MDDTDFIKGLERLEDVMHAEGGVALTIGSKLLEAVEEVASLNKFLNNDDLIFAFIGFIEFSNVLMIKSLNHFNFIRHTFLYI